MQIRVFKKDDAEQLAKLHSRTIRTINAKDHTPEEIETWAGRIRPDSYLQNMHKKHRYVMEDHQKIVGFGEINSDGSELETLYVDGDRQGERIGSAIIQKLLEKARELGSENIITNSSVSARSFYERHGFKEIEKSRYTFPSGGSVECYRMNKKL